MATQPVLSLFQDTPNLKEHRRMMRSDEHPPSESTSWHSSLEAEQERVRALQQIVTDISHDLRTPLTIINSTAFMLRKRATAPEDLELIERIRAQVRRLDQIIDDMFTMAALDVMRPQETYRMMSMNDLAQALYSDFSGLAQDKSLIFAVYPGDVRPVMGEPGSLMRACSNILANAVHYSEPGGRVVISTYLRDSWSVFEVTDTGPGIAPEDLQRIFDRFFRADRAHADLAGGSGLGLAIARRIVEYHHGTIEVESTPGRGSTFRILLPTLERLLPDER